MKLVAAAFAIALLSALAAGCQEKVEARVDCAVAADTSLDCTVKQTKGKSEIKACWGVKMVCKNGATLVAEETCATTKPGEPTIAKVPASKVTIVGTCDEVTSSELVNMSVKGI